MSRSLRRVRRSELPRVPWKNGAGQTQSIAVWPEGAGAADSFAWRISIASIAADGPFSVFSGIERSIVLLAGDGVQLKSADGRIDHRLAVPLVPYTFAGEAVLRATLLGGACEDFNFMTRRDGWRAEVRVHRDDDALAATPHGLVWCVRGTWEVGDAASGLTLVADEGTWWTAGPRALRVRRIGEGGDLISVALHPAAAPGLHR